LAYTHTGNSYGRVSWPSRSEYSQLPKICRKLGVKDHRILSQLLKDPEFVESAKKKLNNTEGRILKIGEKKRRKKSDPVVYDVGSLELFM